MLLSSLLSLSLQAVTWSGIDVIGVYATETHPRLVLAFDLGSRRALLTVNAQDGTPLGKSVGYLADSTPVDPLEGDYAIDVVWDESRSEVFQGQSIVIVDDGRVALDGEHAFTLSEHHDRDSLSSLFPDEQVEAAEVQRSGLEALGVYGNPSVSLLVLPHGRQVIYADRQNTVTRGWVLPPRGGDWRILWEDPTSSPDEQEVSDFRVDADGNVEIRSGFRTKRFRKHAFGEGQRNAQLDEQWNARRAQLFDWASNRAERSWNGWSVTGVYHKTPSTGIDEYIWVDPQTETFYKLGLWSGQLLEDRSRRGRIVQAGARRLNGDYIMDVVWERGEGATTYVSSGRVVDVPGPDDPDSPSNEYTLSDKSRDELAPFLATALPPAELELDLPWLPPGAVYRGGRDGTGNAYICVLENGRDVLIGSKTRCYLTLLSASYEVGHKGERCMSFANSRYRHVWHLNADGRIVDHWKTQWHLPGKAAFARTTEYDFVPDKLKEMHRFWTHPKKESSQ